MRRPLAALAALALAACGGKDLGAGTGSTPGADAWAGPPGMRFTYVRRLAEAPADTGAADTGATPSDTSDTAADAGALFDRTRPLLLTTAAERWEFRVGDDRWSHADPHLSWTVDRGEGFSVEGALLLPPVPAEGFAEDGLAVTAVGEVAVYGGTFPRAVTVERAAGAGGIDGSFVFALDVGPVVITTSEGRWEAARWEAVPN